MTSWVNKELPYHPDRTDLSSVPIALTGGEYYYLYFEQINGGGPGYAQLAVEVTQAPVPDHPQSQREIQYLWFEAEDVKKDTTVLTILNPDAAGKFWLQFRNPAMALFQDGAKQTEISGFPSAQDCKNGVSNYFWKQWDSWVTVTQTQYDVDGLETEVDADTVKIECVIQMTKSISQESSI